RLPFGPRGAWHNRTNLRRDHGVMRIASVADVKAQFTAYLKESEDGPVIVTRNGRPVAVLIGSQDEDEIERLLTAYSPQLQAILERSRQQIREGQWLSHDDFWQELDAKYAESPQTTTAQSKERPARRR